MPFTFFHKGKIIKELQESVSDLQGKQKHLYNKIEDIRMKARFSHIVTEQQLACDELERPYAFLDAKAAALLPALASMKLHTELKNADYSICYGLIIPKRGHSLADVDIAVQDAVDYGFLGTPISESQHLCLSNIQTYTGIGQPANAIPFAGFAHMNLSNERYADLCAFPYPFFLRYTNLISILKGHLDFVVNIQRQGRTFDSQLEDWKRYIDKGIISEICACHKTGSSRDTLRAL